MQKNIQTRPMFYPLSSLPPFRERNKNHVAVSLSPYGINLPCGLGISEEQIAYTCKVLRESLNI